MERQTKFDKTLIVSSSDDKAMLDCAERLKAGEVIGFPTETVYGLGANCFDEEAVDRIFAAKGRPNDNPLIVHVARKDQIPDLVSEITPLAAKLIDAFMPGPITVIMRKSNKVPSNVTAGLDTVGIRMPSSTGAKKFLSLCDCPVAAPSANLSGSPSPTKAIHVYNDMAGYIYAIIDGGQSEFGLESTVVSAIGDIPVILRPGAITKAQIDAVASSVSKEKTTVVGSEKPVAPGMKYRHYAPNAQVEIIMTPKEIKLSNDDDPEVDLEAFAAARKEFDIDNLPSETKREAFTIAYPFIDKIKELMKQNPLIRIGVFCGIETKAIIAKMNDKIVNSHLHFFDYGLNNDVAMASHFLFDGLRLLDAQQVDVILAAGFDGDGISRAYMNRISKASCKKGEITNSMPDESDRRVSSQSPFVENEFENVYTASVLFVCSRNTALSAAAEGLFKEIIKKGGRLCLEDDKKTQVEVYVDSAGLDANEGQRVDKEMIDAIKEINGKNISYIISKQANANLYNENDLILTMRDDEAFEIIRNFPELFSKVWSISTYAASKGLVIKNLAGKVASISIPDPNGENYATYLHTAKAINAWLEILFPYILRDLGARRA